MTRFTLQLFRIPVDPFSANEASREERQRRLASLKEEQLQKVTERLTRRYTLRGVSSANNQMANAFIFGGEITLVLGLTGFIVAGQKFLQIALLPSLLLAIIALVLLIGGVIVARLMGMPTHTKDEVIEVVDQIKKEEIATGEAHEVGRRSHRQRYRLHVNDLLGTQSMIFMIASLVTLALGVVTYVIFS